VRGAKAAAFSDKASLENEQNRITLVAPAGSVTFKQIAGSLARIGSTALDMVEAASPPAERAPLAMAQNAGSEFSGVAVDKVAGTTRNLMNAVSFPRFVNELITGVFKAMNESNQQQLTAFVDLIRNVAQSTEGFADANLGISGARDWLVEHFPSSYQIEGGDEVDMASELEGLSPAEARDRRAEIQAEQDANTRLIMRPGGQPPTESALRSALGAPDGTPLSAGNPEGLVPLARQVLARNRQQLLATMIQMGLQRIVIESGRVHAAMKLHVDASSAAQNDHGSQFDTRTTSEVGIGAKVGPWGAEAKIQNTIGYVSTDRTQTTEGINASADLDSGVELVFKTDYVPLSRLAGVGDVERIRVNTLNPEAEAQRLTAEANARTSAAASNMAERSRGLDAALHTPPPLPPSTINTANLRSGAATQTTTPPTPVTATLPATTTPSATTTQVTTTPPTTTSPTPTTTTRPSTAAAPPTTATPSSPTATPPATTATTPPPVQPGSSATPPNPPGSTVIPTPAAPGSSAAPPLAAGGNAGPSPAQPGAGATIGSTIGTLIAGESSGQAGGAIGNAIGGAIGGLISN